MSDADQTLNDASDVATPPDVKDMADAAPAAASPKHIRNRDLAAGVRKVDETLLRLNKCVPGAPKALRRELM